MLKTASLIFSLFKFREMRVLFCLNYLFVHFLVCNAQSEQLTIVLDKETRSLKELPQFTEITPQKDSIRFVKGIPVKQLSKFTLTRYLTFETSERKLIIPTLIGLDTLERPVFIMDRNMNFDFSDDPIRFYKDTIKKSLRELIVEDSVIIPKKNELVWLSIKYVFIKPSFIQVDYKNEFENNFFLMIGSNNVYTASVDLNGTSSSFIMIAKNPLKYTDQSINLYITKGRIDSIGEENMKKLNSYKVGDTLLIEDKAFRFINFSFTDNSITLQPVYHDRDLRNAFPGFYPYDISEYDIYSNLFRLSDLHDTVVLLDFWGTWCEPCKRITPELIKLNNELKGKKFAIVSIALDKDIELVKQYVKKAGINWVNIFHSFNGENSTLTQYRVTEYPTFVLIDKSGKIIFRDVGIEGFNTISQLIKKEILVE